jgi:hypothetical protein
VKIASRDCITNEVNICEVFILLAVIPPKKRGNNSLVMPSNAACKSFQTSWIDNFGVKIASRDCKRNEVISVKCLFCEKYGKDGTMAKVESESKQQMSSISESLGEAIILKAT